MTSCLTFNRRIGRIEKDQKIPGDYRIPFAAKMTRACRSNSLCTLSHSLSSSAATLVAILPHHVATSLSVTDELHSHINVLTRSCDRPVAAATRSSTSEQWKSTAASVNCCRVSGLMACIPMGVTCHSSAATAADASCGPRSTRAETPAARASLSLFSWSWRRAAHSIVQALNIRLSPAMHL